MEEKKDHEMKMSSSVEDYLEAFLRFEENGSVKSVDVAKALGVSKAAVSIAAKEFVAQGLIDKQSYGEITLTPEGRKIAEEIYERHTVLSEVLEKIGVSPEVAAKDACKVEHVISQETFDCIKKMIKLHKDKKYI